MQAYIAYFPQPSQMTVIGPSNKEQQVLYSSLFLCPAGVWNIFRIMRVINFNILQSKENFLYICYFILDQCCKLNTCVPVQCRWMDENTTICWLGLKNIKQLTYVCENKIGKTLFSENLSQYSVYSLFISVRCGD